MILRNLTRLFEKSVNFLFTVLKKWSKINVSNCALQFGTFFTPLQGDFYLTDSFK